MSDSHESLPVFAKAESIRFFKILVAMAIVVGVVSLPALVIILGLLPAASGYLIVAMASLVLIMVGGWDSGSSDDDSSVESDTGREAILIFTIIYILFAGTFSTLLVASASLGYVIAVAGYPAIGFVAAAGLPLLDHWLAGLDSRLSIVNWSGLLMRYLLWCLSIIYGVRTSSLGDEIQEQRRIVY